MRALPQVLLKHPANSEIARYLRENNPSAHSDLTSEMFLAASGLKEVHNFAPNPASYSYEALHTTEGLIFAAAVGQSTLLVRLAPVARPAALLPHCSPFPPLGPEWAAIPAFQPDIPLAEWRRTLKRAIKAALQQAIRDAG